jgi:hypothetical protein
MSAAGIRARYEQAKRAAGPIWGTDALDALFDDLLASAAALARIRALVDEQSKDEALWTVYLFGQQPVTEAYLQQGLRRLHALIEDVTADPAGV